MFVESPRLRDYHCSDAEKSAILDEVMIEHPKAATYVAVDDGVMVFDTWKEYQDWILDQDQDKDQE